MQWLEENRLCPDPARFALLDEFESGLYEANRKANLTRVPRSEFWLRHVVDCLLVADLVPTGAEVLDLGTGPGFPAWPLAWCRPDLAVTAVDSNAKALGFVRAFPLPNLSLCLSRAEERPERERFGFVTGRAVAPLPIQMEISAAFCKVGGLVVPLRTAVEFEAIRMFPASALGLNLERIVVRPLPMNSGERALPLFRKLRPTDRRFPRTWTQMRAKPLGSGTRG